MLKDFDMIYVDDNGCQHTVRMMAFDADQAWHVFVETHPEVDTIGLQCVEL